MKYKLAGAILVLLIATPLFAQPIAVDTFPPIPSLVKTGETFFVTYRIRYLDLTRWNRELILFSDEIDKDKLQGQVSSFEVMRVDRQELVYRGGEWWQDFVVFFRIIDPKKGVKKLPKLKFEWAIKEAGESGQLKTEAPVESMEVLVNYFSTVPPDPYLDVRDGLQLGDFSYKAWLFKIVLPGLLLLLLLVWIFLLVKLLKKSDRIKNQSSELVSTDNEIGQYVIEQDRFSFGQAKRKLARIVRKVKNAVSDTHPDIRDEKLLFQDEADIFGGIHSLLITAMPELHLGDTPQQIKIHLDNLTPTYLNKNLSALAGFLIEFRVDLEVKKRPEFLLSIKSYDTMSELDRLVNRLTWYNLFWVRVINFPREVILRVVNILRLKGAKK